LTLSAGDVHVWWQTTDDVGERAIGQAVALLSPDEHARYMRFMFDRDRRTFALAHALLRTTLSRYAAIDPAAWEFREAKGGKPFALLPAGAPRLSFNLSHTDGLVACALADGLHVGVDVESLTREASDEVAERCFAPRELEVRRTLATEADRTRRFFELWTLKEAYVKAIGAGLAHPLDTIAFTPDQVPEAIGFDAPAGVDASGWQFALFQPTDRHVLAVAVERTGGRAGAITLKP